MKSETSALSDRNLSSKQTSITASNLFLATRDLVSALYIRWCVFWSEASSSYLITEWRCNANPLGRQDWDLLILAC